MAFPLVFHVACTSTSQFSADCPFTSRRLLGEADHVLESDSDAANSRTRENNRSVQHVRIGGTCVPIMAGSWFAEAVQAL
jgi:hypothetical protein